jgi:predicted Zn-ribbon and HTH transcriptional regulator
MQLRRGEFERIRTVLAEANIEEPLTAREIHDLLDSRGAALDSPHRVATVLGRRAETGVVEVIESQPYRYRLRDSA